MEANVLAFTSPLMGWEDTDLLQLSKLIHLAGRELALHNSAHMCLCSWHRESTNKITAHRGKDDGRRLPSKLCCISI